LSKARTRQFVKTLTSADESAGIGRLNLRLAGFSRQDAVAVDDVVGAIDLVPAFHLEGLREIVYLPEAAPAPSVHRGFVCSRPRAEFLQEERRIYVYDFDGPDMFFHMLLHEIGHFVFFLVIGSRVKKHWVVHVFPGSSCVTPYAESSAIEDFAETYACYVLDPEALQAQYPVKHGFMRDYVFSGDPDTLKERVRGQ
jgi:hypothetical protein